MTLRDADATMPDFLTVDGNVLNVLEEEASEGEPAVAGVDRPAFDMTLLSTKRSPKRRFTATALFDDVAEYTTIRALCQPGNERTVGGEWMQPDATLTCRVEISEVSPHTDFRVSPPLLYYTAQLRILEI